MIALILAGCIMAAVFIPWAIANDNLTALENLDDADVAAAVEEWNA